MKNLILSFIFILSLFLKGAGFEANAQSATIAPSFVLIPATATAPTCLSGEKGKLYFNTTSNKMLFCNGSTWVDFSAGAFTLPYTGSGVQNSGGQAGLVEFINTATGNALYVKSGSGGQLIAGQAFAAYFESSQNGIFATGGAGNIALKTAGLLQFKSNGEGLNKILTSDAVGTATWQSAATLTGLDVNGTATIGTNGTAITEIIKVSLSGNVGNIIAGAEGTATFAIPNAQPGSTVYCSPTQNLPVGVIISHALCEAAGSVEVKFYNASNASIDPPAQVFHVTVIR